MNVSIWKDALRQLRQCDPDIPEFIVNVYNPLKLSYDVLGSKQKSVFLLCCLFPEDANIPLEPLTYFYWGLGIFEGIKNMEDARNSMCVLTNMLKSRSLLLDSEDGDEYVRMHDLVHDICIFIAKQEGYIGGDDFAWISSFQRSEFPSGMGFSNLRLIYAINNLNNAGLKLDCSFFKGIRDLCVLWIENGSMTSLSFTTKPLKTLKTLVLDSCNLLETLSAVGELVNLEILICRNCHSIKELPPEMKGLNRLKLLDITRCRDLQRIGRGIISSLIGLEELKMLGSFTKWEAENSEEKKNAGLRELEALTNLRCLQIEILDPALAAENIHLSSKFDRFNIRFCAWNIFKFSPSKSKKFNSYISNRKMCLHWDGENRLGLWIGMELLTDSECLCLTGNGANNVDLAKFQNIRLLELGECEVMERIVRSMDDGGGATAFSSIEHLRLFKLLKVQEMWDESWNSFQNLKELELYDLPALKRLWKSSRAKGCLPQLGVLRIMGCEMIEQVFSWEGECEVEFPSLREVRIGQCHNMKQLWKSSGEKDCLPQLQIVSVENCKMMENVFLCKGDYEVELPSLREVRLNHCCNMKQLWKKSGALRQCRDCLPQLQVLSIERCEMMEQVFLWNGEDENQNNTITKVFPKLKDVSLLHLPNLGSFYQGIECNEFPELNIMDVRNCRKRERIVSTGMGSNTVEVNHKPQAVSFDCLEDLTTLFGGHGNVTLSCLQ